MLTVLTILLSVVDKVAVDLIAKFPLWKDPFLANLKALVKKNIDTYIGVDKYEDLRNSTAELIKIQTPPPSTTSNLSTSKYCAS